MHRPLFLAILVLIASFSTSANAEWTKTESFEHSAKTSLKITEPAHAKAFVTINGETKEETLPAVLNAKDLEVTKDGWVFTWGCN